MKPSKLLILPIVLFILASCNSTLLTRHSQNEMFRVTILYPMAEGKVFDMDYYKKGHMPLMAKILGENLLFYEIDKGLAGRTSADPSPFTTIGYFYIKDTALYNKSIAENIKTIQADITKYTNIQPQAHISKIVVVK